MRTIGQILCIAVVLCVLAITLPVVSLAAEEKGSGWGNWADGVDSESILTLPCL